MHIDWPSFVPGSALAGYCPGPAVVAAGSGSMAGLAFVAAMVAGMLRHGRLSAVALSPASVELAAQGDA